MLNKETIEELTKDPRTYKDFDKLTWEHRMILMRRYQDSIKRKVKIVKMDLTSKNDLLKKEVVKKIIDGIEKEKINYIVFTQRSTAEYGYSVFGKDYAEDIMSYIREKYYLCKQFGPYPFSTVEYGIAVFKRKI